MSSQLHLKTGTRRYFNKFIELCGGRPDYFKTTKRENLKHTGFFENKNKIYETKQTLEENSKEAEEEEKGARKSENRTRKGKTADTIREKYGL